MRVLVIAYFYPPLSNAGTQRPLKFANYLPDFGWEPTVLTIAEPPDAAIEPGLMSEIRSGTRIVRAPMYNEVIGRRIAGYWPFPRTRRSLSAAISWRIRRRYHVPDPYALWRRPAVQAALAEFRDHPFDAVYATGFPWTALLVGRDVARATRRPFVADFRDPWSGEDLFGFTSTADIARHRALERSVLEQADAVVMLEDLVSLGLLRMPPRRQPASIVTIPNGYDPADVCEAPEADGAVPQKERAIRIVYTGISKKGYGLSHLYAALAQMRATPRDRIEVIGAGFEIGQAQPWHLEGTVRELGRVSHATAIGLMRSADVLYLTSAEGNRLSYHLPGKVYEYLAIGRPILASASPTGDMAALLRQTGGAVVVPHDDHAQLVGVLERLAERGTLETPPINVEEVRRYERRNLTGVLARTLDEVCRAATARGPSS